MSICRCYTVLHFADCDRTAHGHFANAPQVTIKLERKRKRIAITYVIR